MFVALRKPEPFANGIDPTKDARTVVKRQNLLIRHRVVKAKNAQEEVTLEVQNALPKHVLDRHHECRPKVTVHVKNDITRPIALIEKARIQHLERVLGNRETFIEREIYGAASEADGLGDNLGDEYLKTHLKQEGNLVLH